jgi:hypothetical protein
VGVQGPLPQPLRRTIAQGPTFPVLTGADGKFQLVLPAGKGRLFVTAAAPDYVPAEIDSNQVYSNMPGGSRWYAHAVVPLDLKSKTDPPELTIQVRRGVPVKGRTVGPDGKAVTGVRMVTRLNTSAPSRSPQDMDARELLAADFELKGCDPEKAYPVAFLDETNRLGTVMNISGKQKGEPLTVRLQKCGSATARFVDSRGKPMAGYQAEVDVVLLPGPHRFDYQKIQQKGLAAAEAASVRMIHHKYYQWDKDKADAQGRYVLPMLVPGVTYRIWRYGQNGAEVLREFQVKAGQKVDLGDITIK